MKLHRVRRFPSVAEGREAQAIYLERVPGQQYFTFYVTFANPEEYTSSIPQSKIGEWIANAVSGGSSVVFTDSIETRDGLVTDGTIASNCSVVVNDATGDPLFGGTGGMLYLYNAATASFLPITRIKNDPYSGVLWSEIKDGPTSTPEDIDIAVESQHNHQNKGTLDIIGTMEVAGGPVLTFNTKPVGNAVVIEPLW